MAIFNSYVKLPEGTNLQTCCNDLRRSGDPKKTKICGNLLASVVGSAMAFQQPHLLAQVNWTYPIISVPF